MDADNLTIIPPQTSPSGAEMARFPVLNEKQLNLQATSKRTEISNRYLTVGTHRWELLHNHSLQKQDWKQCQA